MASKAEVAEEVPRLKPPEASEVPDYSEMGLKEILDVFQTLLDREICQLYKHADKLKPHLQDSPQGEDCSGFIALQRRL